MKLSLLLCKCAQIRSIQTVVGQTNDSDSLYDVCTIRSNLKAVINQTMQAHQRIVNRADGCTDFFKHKHEPVLVLRVVEKCTELEQRSRFGLLVDMCRRGVRRALDYMLLNL